MLIADIMSKAVVVVSPGTLFNEVARRMLQLDCDCVLVAKDNRLLGIIDPDLVLRCIEAGHYPAEVTVEQVMNPEILYCRDIDKADDLTNNMVENRVRMLAVLDGTSKRLVGVVGVTA